MSASSDNRFATLVAVFVIIRDAAGKVLLQQRENTGYLDGYWDFPSGHVERGEDIRLAAQRELEEEVGLTVQLDDLQLVHVDHYSMDRDYLNFTFAAKQWSGTPTIGEPDKVGAIGWFATDDLPRLCVNTVRVNEQAGFSDQLTYSTTDKSNFDSLVNPEPGGA